jgi:hypothetical protein
MTDRLMRLNSAVGGGRNPITNAGRVARNARLDENSIAQWRENGKKNTALFPPPPTEWDWGIRQFEPCIIIGNRYGGRRGNGVTQEAPGVVSCLNLAFETGTSYAKMISMSRFAGFAGSDGLRYDPSGQRNSEGIALITGGVLTLLNNGYDRICDGDWVVWDIPKPEVIKAKQEEGIAVGRITVILRPLDPASDKVTEEVVCKYLRNMDDVNPDDYGINVVEGASLLRDSYFATGLAFLSTLVRTGLVNLDGLIDAINNDAIRKNNLGEASRRYTEVQDAIVDIANYAGLNDKIAKRAEEKFEMGGRLGWGNIEGTLGQLFADALVAHDPRCHIGVVGASSGGKVALPPGHLGDLVKRQKTIIGDNFAGINQSNNFVYSRIVCRSEAPAEPGEEFDAKIGQYSF